jgi:hypothetical protein
MNHALPPDSLIAEFATVEALLASAGPTRRTDAFILSWVKMEKQLRRIFCFLLYQHPSFSSAQVDDLVKAIVDHKGLYYDTFIRCIDKLGPPRMKEIVGPQYDCYVDELKRIRKYRNKIFHGQITGQKITSRQLEKDTAILRGWISLLAVSSHRVLGYDGVARNTFQKAKSTSRALKQIYPFANVAEFRRWLDHATA